MKNNKQEAMNKLHRINRKLFTAHGPREEELIGRGQINILKAIIHHENISQEELAKKLNLDKTTIAKAVKRLEDKEFITRIKNQDDQRKKELIATKKAMAIDNKMSQHLQAHAEALFAGIDDKEINQFIKTLDKIEANAEDNRMKMHKQRAKEAKVIKAIEANEGISREELSLSLKKDEVKINAVIDRLIDREFLLETENGLMLTSVAKKDLQNHKHHHLVKKIVKTIIASDGIAKDDLYQNLDMDEAQIARVLERLRKDDVLEIKDNKLYIDELKLKERRRA